TRLPSTTLFRSGPAAERLRPSRPRRETCSLQPEIRYAKAGDLRIAYQVTGEGNPVDLVWAPPMASHLMLDWEWPPSVDVRRRLARFCRLIRFDKRGTGLSDPVPNVATLEERSDDIRAVMDAVGSEQAVIFGISEGGSMACFFAAGRPERRARPDRRLPGRPRAQGGSGVRGVLQALRAGGHEPLRLCPARAHERGDRHPRHPAVDQR